MADLEVKKKGPQTITTGYSMSQETNDRVSEMADSMNTSRSSLVQAIINNYYTEIFKGSK